MNNYTTDVVILGRRRKGRQMIKSWERSCLIPNGFGGGRVLVRVWISKPTPRYPLPKVFLSFGFGGGYTLVPFDTPRELDEFASQLSEFLEEIFGEIFEAWDRAMDEAKELLEARYDADWINDSTTYDSTT